MTIILKDLEQYESVFTKAYGELIDIFKTSLSEKVVRSDSERNRIYEEIRKKINEMVDYEIEAWNPTTYKKVFMRTTDHITFSYDKYLKIKASEEIKAKRENIIKTAINLFHELEIKINQDEIDIEKVNMRKILHEPVFERAQSIVLYNEKLIEELKKKDKGNPVLSDLPLLKLFKKIFKK
jgi:hypothetical protein